jgi:hypothetical protein
MHTKLAFTCSWLVACSAVTGPKPGGGSDQGSNMQGSSGSDGGSGSGSDPGSGSGSGSNVGSASGPAITLTGSVYDERFDAVDFSSGVPVHTHGGTPVQLGRSGSTCPDLYMYAYLLDSDAPLYGGETSANPLAWQVAASSTAGIDASASQYRVRSGDGAVLVDWTPLTAQADNALSVVLHRDGAQAIQALGTDNLQLYLDVGMTDTLGNTGSATTCVSYHPLAAPLDFLAIAPESAGEALFGMTLAAGSPISDVLQQAVVVPTVFGQRFVQDTAETVSLALAFGPPSAQYAKTVAMLFVAQSNGSLACGTSEVPSNDPRCSTLTDVTGSSTSSSGAVASGTWAVMVIDEATGAAASTCSVQNLIATCSIPPREAGAAPHSYRLVTTLDDVSDLDPGPGPFSQYTYGGTVYTSSEPTTVSKCVVRSSTLKGETEYFSCDYVVYAKVLALAAAELELAPAAVGVSASVGADVGFMPVPYAPSPIVSSAMTWNAGQLTLP